MLVMPVDDLLVSKLLSLTEHHLDFGRALEISRALREQIDWSDVRRRTEHSPFARAFLKLVVDLGIVDARRRRADERRSRHVMDTAHDRPRADPRARCARHRRACRRARPRRHLRGRCGRGPRRGQQRTPARTLWCRSCREVLEPTDACSACGTNGDPGSRRARPRTGAAVIRIAAVGDIHVGTDSDDRLVDAFAGIEEHADVLLLAGDLTKCGTPDEARVVVHEFEQVTVPMVAVLGNHDHHDGRPEAVADILGNAGCTCSKATPSCSTCPAVGSASPASRASAAVSPVPTRPPSASRR